MKVLIFEDEQAVAIRLQELVARVAPQTSVVAVIEPQLYHVADFH